MSQKITAIRGMNDLLPEVTPYWQRVEALCGELARRYGYREIRYPIVEQTALFKRTIGQATDIVEKEMYTFNDLNGDSLTLRPEGTAGCVRAGIEQSLLYNQIQRLWYIGPMFRHEKPQKGRYRQFHQFGLEAFGIASPALEVEQILLTARLWAELGLSDCIRLEINSLGDTATRKRYREVLVDYFLEHKSELDEDSQRRLTVNPLRILDSKNPEMQGLIAGAPKLLDHLDESSAAQFSNLQQLLNQAGIRYDVNPRLVRGLDYYCHTVYEWITDDLGAQGTVCAGGRYDKLVEQLGGKPTPAAGFALGLERLILLLASRTTCQQHTDIYFVLCGLPAQEMGLVLAEQLRTAFPHYHIECDLADSSMKSQFKRADRCGTRWACVLGEDEIATQQVTIKDMYGEHPQKTLSQTQMIEFFQTMVGETTRV